MSTDSDGGARSPVGPKAVETSMRLRVKTLDSNTHQVAVLDSDTVTELKRKVCDETGVDVNRQRLIFQGKVLKDEKNVRAYAIQDGMTIHMVERVEAPVPSANQRTEPTAPGPSLRQRGAFMIRGEGLSVLPPSPRNVARLSRQSPSSLQISETPDGLVVGASIDLNDERGQLPPMENLLSSVFGLIRRGGSPRSARRPGAAGSRSTGAGGRGNRRGAAASVARSPAAVHSFSVAGLPFARFSSYVGSSPSQGRTGASASSSSREPRSAHGFTRRRRMIDPGSNSPLNGHRSSSAPTGSAAARREAFRSSVREDMNANTVRLRQSIRNTTAQLDSFVSEQESSSAASTAASSSGGSSSADGNNIDQLADSLIGVGDAMREMWPVLQRMGLILKNQQMSAQLGTAAERAEHEQQLLQRLGEPCLSLSGALQTMSDLTSGLSQNLRRIDSTGTARRTQRNPASARVNRRSSGRPSSRMVGRSTARINRSPNARVDEVPSTIFHMMRQLIGASRMEHAASSVVSRQGAAPPRQRRNERGSSSATARGRTSAATRGSADRGQKRKRDRESSSNSNGNVNGAGNGNGASSEPNKAKKRSSARSRKDPK